MLQSTSIITLIGSFYLLISLATATVSVGFSTTTTLPTATIAANIPFTVIPVNKFTYRNSSNDPGDPSIYQSYIRTLYTSAWNLFVAVSVTADGTSSTSAIHITGPAHEVPDLTPSVVASDNATTYWDVCFLYFADLLTNYDTGHPTPPDTAMSASGLCTPAVDLNCFNELAAYFADNLFDNVKNSCDGKGGTGKTWSLAIPKSCSSVVGNTSNGNMTVYTTSQVFGAAPFFVRTDTYTTSFDASLAAARQRTFPIMTMERARGVEIVLYGGVCPRPINGSDGITPKNGAVSIYGDVRMIFVWAAVMLVTTMVVF